MSVDGPYSAIMLSAQRVENLMSHLVEASNIDNRCLPALLLGQVSALPGRLLPPHYHLQALGTPPRANSISGVRPGGGGGLSLIHI